MSRLSLERAHLSFTRREHSQLILDGFDLHIDKGAAVVVLGPSGCGKSSLLNVLAGFQALDSGCVALDGRSLQGPSALRGVVFQDDALMPWLNALDNVALGLQLAGLSKPQRNAKAQQMLELVGLAKHAQHRISELSGGQRQRLGLARALAVEPDFLLLDEPFGALDALTRERMQLLLLQVWKRTGKGLFLITHSIDEALFLATDLLVLDGPPARLVMRRQLPFARRYIGGEPVRSIKADPAFGELRQELLDIFLQEVVDHGV